MDKESIERLIFESWACKDSDISPNDKILEWIKELNENTHVEIRKKEIAKDTFWFYDDYRGEILNRKRSFFSVTGVRYFKNEKFVVEQPVIDQPEIGYLGIVVKKINGILHFLMQAKIEPGNVNCVQISPTIQATKSNFTRAHGGSMPYYFEVFEKASENGVIIYDQIQSEQGSRFLAKRNRNIILLIDKDIPVYSNFKWMTLGQIKQLLQIDNLVNMDTRTVLSGIPVFAMSFNENNGENFSRYFSDQALFNSMYKTDLYKDLGMVNNKLNNFKMFNDIRQVKVPLNQLVDWEIDEYGSHCKKDADFSVSFYEIEIDGREVQKWSQPLFRSKAEALFALFTKVIDGKRKFLVKIMPEVGCFDKVELGPTVQLANGRNRLNGFDGELIELLNAEDTRIMKNVVLSEEGGRFYHEQNRNMIVEVSAGKLQEILPDYIWLDYACLNFLIQTNNNLNIQLRNLLSLLDI